MNKVINRRSKYQQIDEGWWDNAKTLYSGFKAINRGQANTNRERYAMQMKQIYNLMNNIQSAYSTLQILTKRGILDANASKIILNQMTQYSEYLKNQQVEYNSDQKYSDDVDDEYKKAQQENSGQTSANSQQNAQNQFQWPRNDQELQQMVKAGKINQDPFNRNIYYINDRVYNYREFQSHFATNESYSYNLQKIVTESINNYLKNKHR